MELQRQYIITKAVADINSPVKEMKGIDRCYIIDVGQMRVISVFMCDQSMRPKDLKKFLTSKLERYEQDLAERHEL